MSNTMKTVIFIVSLFTFLLFFVLINLAIPPQLIADSPNASFVKAALYMAGYIIALYSQAFMKHTYVKNYMKSLNVFKVLPAKSFELRDRLLILTLPIIAVFMPMVSKRQVAAENLWSLIYLAALAIIVEVLFAINGRTQKIYVADKGIAIDGMDFRIELSVPFSYTNAAGWYPYERVESYLALNNKILLYQTFDLGVITLECSEDEVKQIKGLLVSKRIQERRY